MKATLFKSRVLGTDQKPAEFNAETVEAIAAWSLNLSADRPSSQDLQRQSSEV